MAEILFETTKTRDEELYCVYCHRNKINGKRYIGQTKQVPETRWRQGKRYFKSPHFDKAIKKYGWDNFDHFVIQDNLTKEEADELEILNIAFYNTTDPKYGYNINEGGQSSPISESTKKKISKSLMGHPVSEETRQKMRENRGTVEGYWKGKHLTDEAKDKLRVANLGKTTDLETRTKISISNKGKNTGNRAMNNGVKNIWVKPTESVEDYLKQGYVFGMLKR